MTVFPALPWLRLTVSLPVGVEMRSNWESFMSLAMFTPRPCQGMRTAVC